MTREHRTCSSCHLAPRDRDLLPDLLDRRRVDQPDAASRGRGV